MKVVAVITLIALGFLFSCNKNEKDGSDNGSENLCPVVPASAVPQVVKNSFALRYPSDSVRTWFNKDSVAFCAYFISSAVQKMAQFANNGTFIKEEIETDQQGQHEDSTGVKDTGCECEIDKEGD